MRCDLLICAITLGYPKLCGILLTSFGAQKKKNKPHVNVCKTSTFLSLECLTCDVGKSSLTLLFSQQASVFYRVSPKHKVAIVKVCLAITLFLLYSHLLFFFLDHLHSMNNSHSANWYDTDKRVWQNEVFTLTSFIEQQLTRGFSETGNVSL